VLLSVIVPVYNERPFLSLVLAAISRALPDVAKEVIVVDDFSSDGTRAWLKDNFPSGERVCGEIAVSPDGNLVFGAPSSATTIIRPIYHNRNRGKGGAIRTALAGTRGDVIVIQDADLEYDPADWQVMYDLIAVKKVADVVFGSRFFGRPHRSLYFHHYIANRFISLCFNIFYNQMLSDIECCYKMYTREVKDSLGLTCDNFGIEIEFASQVARAQKWRIYEVGISYYGRSYSEGKKITWRDGFKALWYLLKCRFTLRQRQP
jgi:glycosyltransferase involved in cell wall biosynthesis